jgi:ribosomal protein L37AE/L43A
MDYDCTDCGGEIHPRRFALGYRVCLTCGEQGARAARTSWTIAPAGHKQGYTRVTDPQYLRNMNPKQVWE